METAQKTYWCFQYLKLDTSCQKANLEYLWQLKSLRETFLAQESCNLALFLGFEENLYVFLGENSSMALNCGIMAILCKYTTIRLAWVRVFIILFDEFVRKFENSPT